MSQSSNDRSRSFRDTASDVADGKDSAQEGTGSRGPWLVYVMIGVIIAGIALFLFLRPRGSSAGGTRGENHSQPSTAPLYALNPPDSSGIHYS